MLASLKTKLLAAVVLVVVLLLLQALVMTLKVAQVEENTIRLQPAASAASARFSAPVTFSRQ